jgi:hypothetical protein
MIGLRRKYSVKPPDCSKTPLTPAFRRTGTEKNAAKSAIRAGAAIRLMAGLEPLLRPYPGRAFRLA